MNGSPQAGTAGLSREELQRVAEQVARILGLQQLGEDGAAERLFARSTMSEVCSTRSVGCEIKTGNLAAA